MVNLYEHKSLGTHWIALYMNAKNVIYFGGFGVEDTPKKIGKIIGNINVKTNIYLYASIRFDNVWILLHWIY